MAWSPPLINMTNGIIRHYIINVSEVGTSNFYLYNSSANITNITIDSLHPNYTYVVYIAAVTVDIGPFAEGDSVQTEQDGEL